MMEHADRPRTRRVPLRYAATALLLLTAIAASLAWVHTARSGGAEIQVAITGEAPAFSPRVTVAQPSQHLSVTNATPRDLLLTSTPHTPAAVRLRVPAGGKALLTLTTPGLYHLYDAGTARVVDYQAGNDVVRARTDAPDPNLPDQGWIYVPGPDGVPTDAHIMVPAAHDLMTPRVAVVRVGGSVLIHNHDSDAHNLVTDPADPTGAAFEILGTNGEPDLGGAERRITFTKPGLYHFYCSIHARIVGSAGGWQVVVPRDDSATGFADGDPMESWILVLP